MAIDLDSQIEVRENGNGGEAMRFQECESVLNVSQDAFEMSLYCG